MDTEVKTESADKRMNDLVAVTVVILTVFMSISKVKDDNINQAMQKAKSESVDGWAEYQSARIKLHVDENGLSTLRLLETLGSIDKELAAKQAAEYESDIKKYQEIAGNHGEGQGAGGGIRAPQFPRRPVRHV